MQNLDHKNSFQDKRQILSRKLRKIAENCDHNIDPRYDWFKIVNPLSNLPNLLDCKLYIIKLQRRIRQRKLPHFMSDEFGR
jgi:hypothetical protein